jgi:hypothetical protein
MTPDGVRDCHIQMRDKHSRDRVAKPHAYQRPRHRTRLRVRRPPHLKRDDVTQVLGLQKVSPYDCIFYEILRIRKTSTQNGHLDSHSLLMTCCSPLDFFMSKYSSPRWAMRPASASAALPQKRSARVGPLIAAPASWSKTKRKKSFQVM